MNDSRTWLGLAALLLLGWLVYQLQPVLMPFLVGTLLAYLGDPLVDRLQERGLSRTWGVVAVFALFSLIVLAMLLVLLPLLGRQLLRLYELAPQAIDWLQLHALPWLQAQLGLRADFWQLAQLKTLLTEHLGQTTDIAQMLLARVTSSSLALLAWLGQPAADPGGRLLPAARLGPDAGAPAHAAAAPPRGAGGGAGRRMPRGARRLPARSVAGDAGAGAGLRRRADVCWAWSWAC